MRSAISDAYKGGVQPARVMMAAAVAAFVSMLLVIYFARTQPWLGVTFAVDSTRGVVVIEAIRKNGPAGLSPGSIVTKFGDVQLEPDDIVDEPDTLASYRQFDHILKRQGRMRTLLDRDRVALTLGGHENRTVVITPQAVRPLSSLPFTFWTQIFAGACGFIIGMWVWSLRPRELSAILMALAGVLLSLMIFPAAVYSTREIALDPQLFRLLAAADHFGALGYGVAMVSLFFIYPHRLVPARALWALPLLFGGWWLLDTFWLVFEGSRFGFYLPSLLLMLLFVPAALMQYKATRDQPAMRAALRWFAFTVGLGSGAFVALIVLPILVSEPSLLTQANAFLLFNIVFMGVAIGVARYRLFELDAWAFKILFYLAGATIFICLDAALAYFLALERIPALSISLMIVAMLYLPFRDRLWNALTGARSPPGSLYQQVVDVALSPPDVDQNRRWLNLLETVFAPLQIEAGAETPAVIIAHEGCSLLLPGFDVIKPLRLVYANRGERLFSRSDQALAEDVCVMLRHAIQGRQAREQGVAQERTRIMRDLHDNIGAKLLSALHSNKDDHKERMIRDALSDLRAIINNTSTVPLSLEEVLAETRLETAERLETAGIKLTWKTSRGGHVSLSPSVTYSLRSVIREAVTNVIRHSGATELFIAASHRDGVVEVVLTDNGKGVEPASIGIGNGLTNIRARVQAHGGVFELTCAHPGARLRVSLKVVEDVMS